MSGDITSLRARVAKVGRGQAVYEEMIRSGWWTVRPEDTQLLAEASKRVTDILVALDPLVLERQRIDEELLTLANIDVKAVLEEIRAERIAESRARRAAAKEERRRRREAAAAAHAARVRKTPLHLGHGVSSRLAFTEAPNPELDRAGLPRVCNAEELAAAIGIDAGRLQWLCYHRQVSAVDHYNRFTIPKRSGGSRPIAAPKKSLRVAQRWVFEHIVEKLVPNMAVTMAFRPGVSIVDNARLHAGRAVVMRIDIRNFFPSVTFPRVRGLFESIGYSPGVATLLGLVCTEAPRRVADLHGRRYAVATGPRGLPQGACTSPGLANFACRRLDARIRGYARKLGFRYTRYADDLVFSHEDADAPVDGMRRAVYRILRAEGFEPNEAKTCVMRRHQLQVVTGIAVNTVPRVSREAVRRFRAIAHQCRTRGVEAVTADIGRDALAYLNGYLSFVRMVNPAQADRLAALVPESGSEKGPQA